MNACAGHITFIYLSIVTPGHVVFILVPRIAQACRTRVWRSREAVCSFLVLSILGYIERLRQYSGQDQSLLNQLGNGEDFSGRGGAMYETFPSHLRSFE